MDTKTFSSEEERNEYIAGDREKRIELDTADILLDLEKLRDESQKINEASKELNNFYVELENNLRGCQISNTFFLKTDDSTKPEDGDFRLCCTEEVSKDCAPVVSTFYFWRIGWCRIGDKWRLAAQKYRINPVEGEKPHHEVVGDPIRLTYGPRDLRTAAAHRMRYLIHALLKQVMYDRHCTQNALERIRPLVESVRGL